VARLDARATPSESTATALLRLCDLGPLAVDLGGRRSLVGGSKPVRVLSRLLLDANRRVSVDALLEAVWGDRPPTAGVGTLESHVWRLRKLMEPDRPRQQPPSYLVNDGGGYRLVVDTDNVDSLRFARLVEQGDDLLLADDPARALNRYEVALGLWRGTPFEGVADEPWAAAAVGRLQEMFAQLNEQHAEALLRLGETRRAIVSLERLLAQHPLRERLWAQLMLARYRDGRVGESLQTYLDAREVLLDEIGVEPGPELDRLQQRVLDRDPTLAAPAPAVVRAGGATQRAHGAVNLPARLSPLIARDRELARLPQLLARHRLVTLVGAGGCGKTRLSVDVARASAAEAPDGVWFVDLTAVGDADADGVATLIMSTIGIGAGSVGGARASLRSYLRDRQVLLVLDNCEHVLGEVRSILTEVLGEDRSCRVLATSREPVGIDGEVLWPLAPLGVRKAGAAGADGRSAAAALFWSKVEAVAPLVEDDPEAAELVEQICTAVDGLPLAVELAAGRIRVASLQEILDQVREGLARLSRVGSAGPDHHQTVEQTIEWSVRLLDDAERAVHRRLSVLPGAFTREVAAAVSGFDPLRSDEVPELLGRLVNRSLLEVVPPQSAGEPTRFRQLATVRAHAEHSMAAAAERSVVVERRAGWVREHLAGRPDYDAADTQGWEARTEHNHDTVTAVLAHALVETSDPFGVHVAARLRGYWLWRSRPAEGARWLRLALAQPAADPVDRQEATLGLANLTVFGRPDVARGLVDEVLRDPELLEPRVVGCGLTAVAFNAWTRGHPGFAFLQAELQSRADTTQDPVLVLYADLLRVLNEQQESGPVLTGVAVDGLLRRALDLGRAWTAWVCGWISLVCAIYAGDAEAGPALMEQQVELHAALGATMEASLLEYGGAVAILAGDVERGVELLGRSRLSSYRTARPWPISPATTTMIARAQQSLPAEDYDRAWRRGEAQIAS
jgi:predicted ATPase/DNA-binding SARP family transcriptional activator